MKSPVFNKRGQSGFAMPVILIGFAFLFIIYLLMVYPSEREKLLGFESEGQEITESPLGGTTELIFSSGETFEVGRTMGQTVFNFGLKNFSVSYAPIAKKLDSAEGVMMSASLLSAGIQAFNANNLNLETTKEIVLKLDVKKVTGSPKIVIILNESRIYEKDAAAGELTIHISKNLLTENNQIFVKVEHSGGAFWETQSVEFNSIILDQMYYDPYGTRQDSQTVVIGENNYQGNQMNLKFFVDSADNNGDLLIKVNDKIIWSGNPTSNHTITASVELDKSGIAIGNNNIVFEADKDGSYTIKNVTLQFIAESTPPARKTYSFDITSAQLHSGRQILFGVKVNRIIEPGSLYFQIAPSATSYYFPAEDVASGAWSYTKLDASKLKEFGNKITVDSVNGRFSISGFVIILG
jgi:hypothetical protein